MAGDSYSDLPTRNFSKKQLSDNYGWKEYSMHAGAGVVIESAFCFVLIGVLGKDATTVIRFAAGFFVLRTLVWILTGLWRTGPIALRIQLYTTLTNMLPFLVYAWWLSEAYIQPHLRFFQALNRTVIGETFGQNAEIFLNKTVACNYKVDTKSVLSTESLSTMASSLGVDMNYHLPSTSIEEVTASYTVTSVECDPAHPWAEFVAPQLGNIVWFALSLGVPTIFAFLVFGAMKSLSRNTSHALMVRNSFSLLQVAVLDFFDACQFLAICFEATGVNFVFLTNNPKYWTIIGTGFTWCYLVAIFEILLPFRLVPCTPWPHWASALLSLSIDLPLGGLRLMMLGKGLKFSTIMLAKNFLMAVNCFAIIAFCTPNNKVSEGVGKIFSFLPGYSKIEAEAIAEQQDEDASNLSTSDRRIKNAEAKMKKQEWELSATRVCTAIALNTNPPPDHVEMAFLHFSKGTQSIDQAGMKNFTHMIFKSAREVLVDADNNDEEEEDYMDFTKEQIQKCTMRYAGENCTVESDEFVGLLRAIADNRLDGEDDEDDGEDDEY